MGSYSVLRISTLDIISEFQEIKFKFKVSTIRIFRKIKYKFKILDLIRTIPADWASDVHPEAPEAIDEVTHQLNLLFFSQLAFQEKVEKIFSVFQIPQVLNLYHFHSLQAVFTVLTIVFFRSQPDHPPSIAEGKKRAAEKNAEKEKVLASLKSYFRRISCFLKNIYFMILMIAAGLLGGTLFTIFTLINQIVKSAFCDQSVSFLMPSKLYLLNIKKPIKSII